jgi:hypothetical protein
VEDLIESELANHYALPSISIGGDGERLSEKVPQPIN